MEILEAKVSLCVCLGHPGEGLTQTLECARLATSPLVVGVANHASAENESTALQWANPSVSVTHIGRRAWTAGANRLITAWDGEYTLFSDPGIRFPTDLPEQMIRYMEEHPDVAALSPVISDAEDKMFPLPRYPLCLRDLLSLLLYSRGHSTRRFRELTQCPRFFQDPEEIPYVSARLMMVRSDALRALKGFDTGFGRYLADFDLCERIRSAHLGKVMIHPGLRVQGEKEFSGVTDSLPRSISASLRFAVKWHLRP